MPLFSGIKNLMLDMRFRASMWGREVAEKGRNWAIYALEGEKGLGKYLNLRNEKLLGKGIDARNFDHPKLPALIDEIEKMAAKAGIKTPAIEIKSGIFGSPLAAEYNRIHIDPTALDTHSVEELSAYAGHEVAHIENKDIIGEALGTGRKSRTRAIEMRADRRGAELSGKSGVAAESLEKEGNRMLAEAKEIGDPEILSMTKEMLEGKNIYPPMKRRVEKLRKMETDWASKIQAESKLPREKS